MLTNLKCYGKVAHVRINEELLERKVAAVV
jgi:hypothetical protein